MRILVLGAGGMAGHVITLRLQEKGHRVTGLARRALPFCETVVADVRDAGIMEDTLRGNRFDALVNAIGILPQAFNAGQALYDGLWINACLPHLLADVAERAGIRIIHLSTDCVFSGHDAGKYTEASFRSADDYYGRSKALGELRDAKNLTFRTSIVGPDINEGGSGLFNWFMRQRGQVNGFSRVLWTGTTTITLADAIHEALSQRLTGLYHLVNGDVISKHDLLALFNGLRRESLDITMDDRTASDKSLIDTRKDFSFTVPSYADMVAAMGEWIEKHKALYPHYS